MTLRRLLVLLALHLCYLANVGHSFNIDTDFPILLGGPNNGNLNKHFGHSLQLYEKVSGLRHVEFVDVDVQLSEWTNQNSCGRSTKC